MSANGPRADIQHGGDDFVLATQRHHAHDLALTGAQRQCTALHRSTLDEYVAAAVDIDIEQHLLGAAAVGKINLGFGARIGYGNEGPDETDESLIVATVQYNDIARAFFDV